MKWNYIFTQTSYLHLCNIAQCDLRHMMTFFFKLVIQRYFVVLLRWNTHFACRTPGKCNLPANGGSWCISQRWNQMASVTCSSWINASLGVIYLNSLSLRTSQCWRIIQIHALIKQLVLPVDGWLKVLSYYPWIETISHN